MPAAKTPTEGQTGSMNDCPRVMIVDDQTLFRTGLAAVLRAHFDVVAVAADRSTRTFR